MIQGNKKEIDIELCENFEDKNYLIKELFNNYIKLENNINYINNDNKLLKEENNNLKNEIYNLKQNYNNDINELKMQIMNYNNMINQIQQQLNQINNIYQEINIIKNQISTINIDINSINLNNKLSLNNNIINNNEKINVNFIRQSGTGQRGPSFMVYCHFFENISTLIRKYRNKSGDYSCNRKFIHNAKSLDIYSPLTIIELGITNDSNIFVINSNFNNEINYRFLNDDIHIKFKFSKNSKLSEYLDYIIRDFVLNPSDIINYIYNSKKVDKDYIIKESEFQENSEIIIKLNKQSLYFINIKFKELYSVGKELTDIKCLNKEKISSILTRFKLIKSLTKDYLRFLFKTIEINELNSMKLDLTAEDFGLKNNSVILYRKEN